MEKLIRLTFMLLLVAVAGFKAYADDGALSDDTSLMDLDPGQMLIEVSAVDSVNQLNAQHEFSIETLSEAVQSNDDNIF